MTNSLLKISVLLIFSIVVIGCKKKYEVDKTRAFVKYYGGLSMDNAVDVQQTSDGGYVIAGTSLVGASADMLIIKTDAEGNEEWHQTFGGPYYDECASVAELPSGGYILLGTYGKSQRQWDVTKLEVNKDTTQMYAVKVSTTGNLVWERKYDYSNSSVKVGTFGRSIVVNPYTSECLFAGMVDSSYGSPGSEFINLDLFALIVETGSGNLKQVLNTATNAVVDMKPLRYGTVDKADITTNAVSLGSNYEYQISTSTNISGSFTPRLVSCRLNGIALVQNTAPTKTDWIEPDMFDAAQIAVSANPNEVLLTGSKEIGSIVNRNIYVVRLSSLAGYTKVVNQDFGDLAGSYDVGVSVAKTSDGGYVVLGNTNSTTYTGNSEKLIDVVMFKVDQAGNESWNKVFGGKGDDKAVKILQTSDGGYLICGTIAFGEANTNSSDKLTLIKVNSEGEISNTF